MQNDNQRFETLTLADLDAVNGGMMRTPTVPQFLGGGQGGPTSGGSLLNLIDAILGIPQPGGSSATGGYAS